MRLESLLACLLLLPAACDPKGGVGADSGDPADTDTDTDADTDTDTDADSDADTDTGDCLPQIEASPSPVDFGTVSLGFYASATVTLSSVGCADLQISGFSLSGADFHLLTHSESMTLTPGSSTSVSIGYQTYDEGVDEGQLTVTSDDPDGDLVVPLTATGG